MTRCPRINNMDIPLAVSRAGVNHHPKQLDEFPDSGRVLLKQSWIDEDCPVGNVAGHLQAILGSRFAAQGGLLAIPEAVNVEDLLARSAAADDDDPINEVIWDWVCAREAWPECDQEEERRCQKWTEVAKMLFEAKLE